jgi:uncharacterized protein
MPELDSPRPGAAVAGAAPEPAPIGPEAALWTRRVWSTLAMPPLAFLIVVVAGSVVTTVAAGPDGRRHPEAVARAVAEASAWLLLVVQVVLAGVTWRALRAEGITWRQLPWRPPAGRSVRGEVGTGVVAGVLLAVVYLTGLSPLMVWAQRDLGDYVPPGELLASLGGSLAPFFVANVLLAPLVEESLYRGYALPRLMARYRTSTAVVISCVGFGLLHWAGGVWYIVLTGAGAGGLFAGLFARRANLVVTFSAHLALNLVEFGYVAWHVVH